MHVPGSDERRDVPATQTISSDGVIRFLREHYEKIIDAGVKAVRYPFIIFR